MKKNYWYNHIYFFLLIASFTMQHSNASETDSEKWLPFPIDSKSVDVLLEEVDRNGSHLVSQEFTPYRAEGLLQQCGYTFVILMRDWAYRSNQPIIVDGSL